MLKVNFFESPINITLTISDGQQIIATNNGETLFTADQFTCIGKLRRIIREVSTIANKQFIFHINCAIKDTSVANNIRGYLKSNLELMNSTSNCDIKVNAHLYNIFA